jgi:tetratricopeptide (TPR) repeat protein
MRLEEAVAAYREALKEYTRERVPLQWAMTHRNLATTLQTLGEREEGTDRLEEAVSSYREALKEYTRYGAPLDWAAMQNNLGKTLCTLAERECGTLRLEEARGAMELARDVYRGNGIDRYDTSFETRLRAIDNLIGSRRSGS